MGSAPDLVSTAVAPEADEDASEPSDAQYGWAIVRGLFIGWVVVPVVVGVLAFFGAPDAGFAFWAGTGLAVGFWCGLFLGGVFSLSVFQLRREAAEARRSAARADGPDAADLAA